MNAEYYSMLRIEICLATHRNVRMEQNKFFSHGQIDLQKLVYVN